jgi:aminoglycoside/choline kinase family phosphotransferase
MLNRFCHGMAVTEGQIFLDWYRVLATQFHCRVIGQFIRLAVRDGKDRYLQHIPRVAGYIREGLRNPVLKPMADWCRAQGLDFSKTEGFQVEAIRPLIRADAF